MAQTLVLGLGGTGSRAVNNLAKILQANGHVINNGDMYCAVFDTNSNDIGSIKQSNTGIPVFPTSKQQKISDYLTQYNHLNVTEWCPKSPAFLEESMLDGASELRIKSRIAFLDCINSDFKNDVEKMINEVLDHNDNSKIRIMIVSSLAGGTGSGMFIQVALWLRKFLSNCQITIRGIFLLPDVFINTVEDVRKNKTTQVRHYCNAYAAIRELNAISKIMKSGAVNLDEEISIGDLFNSTTDADTGKPVYDLVFFVDYKDENNISLGSIGEYEELLAQLVYMQMHAPMKDDMYSEEDNAFLTSIETDEPLYGSCGTAKAVYPVDSVENYCVLRATHDSLSENWKRIDSEIAALETKRTIDEENGIFTNDAFVPKAEYMKIFERKTSVSSSQTGHDRFFFSIANDVKNETVVRGEDKSSIRYTDKVSDFITLLQKEAIDKAITDNSGTDDYRLNEETFVDADHDVDELLAKASSDEVGLSDVLDTFDENVVSYANTILDTVLPYSMGDINANNKCSVYALLSKTEVDRKIRFVHPVAARYILYKLESTLESEIRKIDFDTSRDEAITGGDVAKFFDNKLTPETEKSPKEFLDSRRKWRQRKEAFIDDFESRYAQFINSKVELCKTYQTERLKYEVFTMLLSRVSQLVKQVDLFFTNLDDVIKKTKTDLESNLSATTSYAGKTLFVCSEEKHKKAIYESLDLDVSESNYEINKSVINTLYGCFCAKERPKEAANAAYLNVNISVAFYLESTKNFRDKIINDPNNFSRVHMNIYTAICKESDIDNNIVDEPHIASLDDVNIAKGKVEINDNTSLRHEKAFIACTNAIYKKAAPFLIHDREIPKDAHGCETMRPKTFWGFSKSVSDSCSQLGAILGINADLQADDGYLPNELYCYRAVYCIEAKYIPKFNELKGGQYFSCYTTIINDMIAAASKHNTPEKQDRAYVSTPHLDKRWHKLLPFVSPDKELDREISFYRGFWLAIAYGALTTDKDGNIIIRRYVRGGSDTSIENRVPLTYNGTPLKKTDAISLIAALKKDEVFNSTDIPELEKKFETELKTLSTYVGTDVLKGLCTSNDDLNPVTFVCRYNDAQGSDIQITAYLIGALERIAKAMAAKYNVDRSETLLNKAKFKICKMIYDSSTRIKGKTELFNQWEEAFKTLN